MSCHLSGDIFFFFSYVNQWTSTGVFPLWKHKWTQTYWTVWSKGTYICTRKIHYSMFGHGVTRQPHVCMCIGFIEKVKINVLAGHSQYMSTCYQSQTIQICLFIMILFHLNDHHCPTAELEKVSTTNPTDFPPNWFSFMPKFYLWTFK